MDGGVVIVSRPPGIDARVGDEENFQ
jgi:hypothetical protein